MQQSHRCNIWYHLHTKAKEDINACFSIPKDNFKHIWQLQRFNNRPYITFNMLCILTRCLSLLHQVNLDSSHFVKSIEAAGLHHSEHSLLLPEELVK